MTFKNKREIEAWILSIVTPGQIKSDGSFKACSQEY